MPFVVDLLADLMSRMSCVAWVTNGVEWLDCIDAQRAGLRDPKVPICARCKIKAHLDKLIVDIMRPTATLGA